MGHAQRGGEEVRRTLIPLHLLNCRGHSGSGCVPETTWLAGSARFGGTNAHMQHSDVMTPRGTCGRGLVMVPPGDRALGSRECRTPHLHCTSCTH